MIYDFNATHEKPKSFKFDLNQNHKSRLGDWFKS